MGHRPVGRLNEVQLPKELQQEAVGGDLPVGVASMKCSSRRNCNMKSGSCRRHPYCLNEVQLPKELQLVGEETDQPTWVVASMKCSSRRNCNLSTPASRRLVAKPQ